MTEQVKYKGKVYNVLGDDGRNFWKAYLVNTTPDDAISIPKESSILVAASDRKQVATHPDFENEAEKEAYKLNVMRHIRIGVENAVSENDFLTRMGVSGAIGAARKFRLAKQSLQEDGILVCSLAGGNGGTYVAASSVDRSFAEETLQMKIDALQKGLEKIRSIDIATSLQKVRQFQFERQG